MSLLLLLVCHSPEKGPGPTDPLYACGNGVLDATEACDAGTANSDVTPDVCRSRCQLPACGDGVVDAGEECDDGALWGGDGCDPACFKEPGVAEVEPNDDPSSSMPLSDKDIVSGSLFEGDQDCYSLVLPGCGAIHAVQIAGCDPGLLLSLYDPSGSLLAASGPGNDGCSELDPAEEPGARWVQAGTWSLCVQAIQAVEHRGYSLQISSVDPLAEGLPTVGSDQDFDTIPDSCDTDRDGDGFPNDSDNCPEASNGPSTPYSSLHVNGEVRDWSSIGPFTTGVSADTCRPSEDLFVGEDHQQTAVPGDSVGELFWVMQPTPDGFLDFLPSYGGVSAPREAYALAYFQSVTARQATLLVGADDGVFTWWNGQQVLDVASCQGVNLDQFQAPIQIEAGWNSLLLKVYDQGGGWGLVARFVDENGSAILDLQPSLHPDELWRPDQSDGDADGLGDLCDPTP